MHRILPLLVASSLLAASVQAQTSAEQASTTTPSSASSEDVLKNLRADMQSSRADIMAKNLTLSADQAAKFWPVFEAYQKQQNTIMDAQLKDLQKYVETYKTLDDAGALALMNAHLQRDAKMTALRQKWLGDFQKVLPTKLAVRAMQIDRRLSLLAQMEVSGQIPLVH
jgi:Spy/CpxP family protein refolding chaperone